MSEQILWTIGAADGRSKDLVDTYEQPLLLGDVLWRAGEGAGEQRWPTFHPSEADPEGGYRLHPYTIEFPLDAEPRGTYRLRVHYLVITPRPAHLGLDLNGVSRTAYLRPAPSRSGEIRLHAGLHAALYGEGVVEVAMPAALLRRGTNRLTLTARDDGEVIRIERVETIKRRDRVANGAGFVYQQIAFSHLDAEPDGALAAVEVRPSVVYQAAPRRDASRAVPRLPGAQRRGRASPSGAGVARGGPDPARRALAVEGDNVVVSALKQAEDGDDLIVRCYETAGTGGLATIRLSTWDRVIKADFSPFEIRTFRVPRDEPRPVIETNLNEWPHETETTVDGISDSG